MHDKSRRGEEKYTLVFTIRYEEKNKMFSQSLVSPVKENDKNYRCLLDPVIQRNGKAQKLFII